MHPVQYPGIDLPREAEEWDPPVAGAHFPVPFLKRFKYHPFLPVQRECLKSTCIIAEVFYAISILSKSLYKLEQEECLSCKSYTTFLGYSTIGSHSLKRRLLKWTWKFQMYQLSESRKNLYSWTWPWIISLDGDQMLSNGNNETQKLLCHIKSNTQTNITWNVPCLI